MARTQAEKADKIDAMMEKASKALVRRQYFVAEKLAASALRRAHHEADYDRMARIILPLQEARRQKRDLATDTGRVFVVDGEIPTGKALVAGCYLVAPPRVGVDGRTLREIADEKKVPVVVIVREPESREGLWPIVAVGPVTVRAKVKPPKARPVKSPKKPAKGSKAQEPPPVTPAAPALATPTPEWFTTACETLGDEAILQVPATLHAAARVAALMDRLEAHPNHEKLHQRLEEACKEAIHEPPRKRRAGFLDEFSDEFD